MAPKRPNTTEETATARKKAKTTAARTIRIQEPSAQAGPSSVTLDSMKKLPGAIQVEKFAEARAFEIDAMHNAMQNSSEHSAQRAWQALPRHLRRRAASHDPRRVPTRLRERAKAEIDGPIRKRRHKVKKGTTTAKEFAKRQRDKSWLETHVWHAKRMIMKNMWGYRLAVKPTEKSFRPSHRAAMHGSILHDASYEGPIEVSGPLEILKLALEQCCDCQGPSPAAPRFADGSRAFSTYIYEFQTYPLALVSPASIIWQPRNSIPQKPATKSQGKGKGKGKAPATSTPSTPISPAAEKRTLWLRCHADAFQWVFQILQRSVTFALDTYNKAHPDEPSQDVEIADLRGEVNIFEIMGPQANQVLRGALRAVPRGEGEFDQFWASLKDLQTSGAVPRNMIVGFTVDDPRLRFPPKRAKPDDEAAQSQSPTFPSPALAASIIWDPDVRKKLTVPKYTQKQLDERRAKNLVPGTPLNTLRLDDRVPVLLVQRSVEPLSPSTSGTSSLAPSAAPSRTSSFNRTNSSHSPLTSPSTPSQPIHGWTLIFPAGWGMAFLPSLVHTGTRVAGQRERASQSFEAGVPHFPQDVPGDWTTLAQYGSHESWWAMRAIEEQARWERTPPSKRPNWAALGTASMWMPDWRQVLGIEPMFEYPGVAEAQEKAQEAAEEFVSAQREEEVVNDANMEDAEVVERADETMDADAVNPEDHPRPKPTPALLKPHIAQPWLLRGPETRQVLQRLTSVLLPAEALKSEIFRLRGKRGLPLPGQDACADRNSATTIAATIPDPRNPISTADINKADTLLQTALIQVRVQMCRRGRPGDLAAIYAVDDAERRNWARALAEKARQPVMDRPEDSDSDDEDGLQDEEHATKAQEGMSVKEIELANVMPDLKDNIGFVTTGNYSLARGEGFGIGSIALTALLKLEEQRVRMNEKFWFVKVKNRNSAMCRAARIEVVD